MVGGVRERTYQNEVVFNGSNYLTLNSVNSLFLDWSRL